MASTFSLCSLTFLPSVPFSGSMVRRRRSSSLRTTFAMRKETDNGQNDYSGKLVDENLIVLRKRIHEMKMIQGNHVAPAEWMDWEKSFYTSYNSIICEIMGILQSKLMNTRPSLAIGMIALVALTMPTSTIVTMLHLIDLDKEVFAGTPLG